MSKKQANPPPEGATRPKPPPAPPSKKVPPTETMILWPVIEPYVAHKCPDCGYTEMLESIRTISQDLCPVCTDTFLRSNVPAMKPVKKD